MSYEISDIASAIERAFQATRQSAAAVALLYASGAATCQDVRSYNMLALAIYNTQKTMLETLIANGVNTNGMTVPPTPTLFYWNNVAGTDAAAIDCSKSPLAGFGAAPSRTFLPPGSIRIVTADPNWQNPQPTLTAAQLAGQLGEPISIGLAIVIGAVVIIIAAAAIYGAVEWLKAREITNTVANQLDTKAATAKSLWSARAGYVSACKDDTATCAARAIQLYPEPDLSVEIPGQGGLGVLGWVGVIAIAGVGGIFVWKKYERDGHILPRRSA